MPNGVRHVVRHSVAFDNKAAGFYANHHPLALEFTNNTAFANGADYDMLGIAPDGSPIALGILRANIAYRGRPTVHVDGLDMARNSWTLPVTITDADFQSVSERGWDAPRQADGSLPLLRSFHLRPGSPLVGMGAFE